jgi:hypothetical protein
MKSDIQVWSAGTETWEDTEVRVLDICKFVHVHDKHVGHEMYAFFKDPLNRWFRAPISASHV